MRRDILIAIVGTSIFIAGLIFISFRRHKTDEIIYVDCDSFKTQQEAQEYFLENNATQLDADRDGVACQHLPIGVEVVE